MYENIFKRVEEKYLITQEQKDLLLKNIKEYITKDTYFQSKICNIYFDTLNHDLIINSLEKPIFKEKVRIRSYDIPKKNDYVFLEMKIKYKGVVGKRRIKLTLNELYDYINNHHFDKTNQIMKEIDYYFKYYNLTAAIFIAYDRTSYLTKNDNIRITFDSNLRSRNDDLYLEHGDKGQKYFEDNIYIMEIKTLKSLPLWLTKELSALSIYPTSFSKYGKIYTKQIQEGVNLC